MSLQELKSNFPEYAKDVKLNVSKVFSEEGAPGLSLNQIYGVALAAAYCTKNPEIIRGILKDAQDTLSENEITAAKSAATIMGMNNVYYRFLHLSSDKEYGQMPAQLRMNVIANPGIEKVTFELMSLGVSALNGCGMCMDAHVREVVKGGISKLGVQSAIRIAAVLASVAQVMAIEGEATPP